MHKEYSKAYIVAVDMGHGHQRAAFPLIDIATTPKEWNLADPIIISANDYPGIPFKDRVGWESTRRLYEQVSRWHGFPLLGRRIFHMMDYLERIQDFYPKRDLSKVPFQLRVVYKMMKDGFGKHLIDTLNKDPLPLVTTFFVTAFFAEEHKYKGEIYCLCTDTDIARPWAPIHPKKSKINYLAPNKRVKERLMLYGIREEKITITGFPLPKEILGDEKTLDVAKRSLARRIVKLDKNGLYQKKYKEIIDLHLNGHRLPQDTHGPVVVSFAVGGAGAQSDIGVRILKSLAKDIRAGNVRLNLIAGTSPFVFRRYNRAVRRYGFRDSLGKEIKIIFSKNKYEYFKEFNKTLVETDVLWTKPSELSFYVGAGIPIIMAPALGVQEESNKAWLHMVGAGFEQENPKYTNEWLFDWLESDWLAEAAMNGFMDAPKRGVYHIEDFILKGQKTEIEDIHFL